MIEIWALLKGDQDLLYIVLQDRLQILVDYTLQISFATSAACCLSILEIAFDLSSLALSAYASSSQFQRFLGPSRTVTSKQDIDHLQAWIFLDTFGILLPPSPPESELTPVVTWALSSCECGDSGFPLTS